MRKIFTVSRVLLTAALYGLVIQSQAAPDKGELEVLVNGVVGPTWVQGITGVSDDIPWTSCVGDGGLNCNNIKWQFVNDTERGQVLEVSHKEVSATGYAFLEIAKTKDISYPGVNLSAFAGGYLDLDIKVIDSGENSSGFSAYINCFYPCQGSKTIGPVGLQGWETVRIPIDELVQAGLNLSDVNLGLGLHPNFGEMDRVVYRLDNVIWKSSAGANQNGVENSMLRKSRQVSQGENLLLNGNFQIGSLSGWNRTCCDPWPYGAVGPTYGPTSGVFPDPSHPPGVVPENLAALINSAAGNEVSFLQTQLPAREGDVFSLSGSIMREAEGNPYSFSLLKIVFEDEDGFHLEPAEYLVGAPCYCFPWVGIESDFVTSSDASKTWHFREAKGRAPAGTARVSFFALNVDLGRNQYGDSRIWFDDLEVTEFPEDYSARMLIESKEIIDRHYESTGNASVANLSKHLEAAIDLEAKGITKAALSQIQLVLKRTDGCHFKGAPDSRGQSQDYIEDCNLQNKLISRLHAAKAGLR